MFCDVHSHILCGIDDGARNIQETQGFLKLLQKSGITHLALTPHYYPYERSIASFLKRRERAFQALKALPEAKKFAFTLGAEVYLGETLLNNESLLPLCYEGTRYMLTELEYTCYFTDSAQYRLLRLIEDYDIIPVLAHIDRYPFLWKDMRLLEKLKRMGCCFQMNLSALQGFFSRHQAMRLYEKGFIDFLGEDTHQRVFSASEKEKLFLRVEKSHKNFGQKLSAKAVAELFCDKK